MEKFELTRVGDNLIANMIHKIEYDPCGRNKTGILTLTMKNYADGQLNTVKRQYAVQLDCLGDSKGLFRYIPSCVEDEMAP